MTTDLRCPSCGSLVVPGAAWCSLCHEDLRTEEERAAARAQAQPWEAVDPQGAEAVPVPSGAATPPDAATPARPGGGRHRRPAPADPTAAATRTVPVEAAAGPGPAVDAALAEAGIDVAGMLELLAANEGRPLSPLQDRLSDKGTRVLAVVTAVTVLTVVGIAVMTVLGSLLR